MAQHLRVALERLWRCRACGTVWTAAYDQYQAYHYAHQPLSASALAALQADAGVAAVQALMASKPPAFLLRALLAAPSLTLTAATRRRLAKQAEQGEAG